MENKGTGLNPNVAGTLSYVLGFVTGIFFFVIEKDKYIRFHALQSIIVFGFLFVSSTLLGFIPFIGILFSLLITPLSIVLWVLLMVKAYQGKKYKIFIAGDIAERNA